jgi:ABC-type phosphate/phosphonate transport system substrate-binding protein
MDDSQQRMTRRQSLALMAGAAAAALGPKLCRSESGRDTLRLAISADTLAGANINDARTAYRVWIREVLDQLGHHMADVVPEVYLPSEELIRDVRQGTLDCYGVTAVEFEKLVDVTDPESVVLEDYQAGGMEYVLVVHNSSTFKKLADLRDARILSHLQCDMTLLAAWLGTLLAANNLPQPDHFFASQERSDRLNMVVLPVFFRRVDGACLALRSWETAVELNPQLGHDLHVLAMSPKVVPVLLAFRRNTSVISRKTLIDSIQRINTLAAGQQIVALYQSRGFVVRPASVMKGSLEMVREFERVSGQTAHARKGPA